MPTFQIFGELAARPVTWVAGLLLYVGTMVVFELVGTLAEAGAYQSLAILSQVVGVGLFAAFIFPLARILTRDRITLGPPRWIVWIIAAIAERMVLSIAAAVLAVVLYLTASDFMASEWGQWWFRSFEALLSPLLIGLFLWKIGLVCGSRTATFGSVHRFVWGQRRVMILVYFAVQLADIGASAALATVMQGMNVAASRAIFTLPATLSTWVIGLLLVALFLDYSREQTPIEDVFS